MIALRSLGGVLLALEEDVDGGGAVDDGDLLALGLGRRERGPRGSEGLKNTCKTHASIYTHEIVVERAN